jgi:beta-phosphoglucomutase
MAQGPSYAVIWDVDGTMVDTAELHFAAWQQLAAETGMRFSRADFLATFGRRNPDILHELFGEQFTDQQVAALGDRKEELYRAAAGQGIELLPGVRPLLEGLHAAAFKQAVGSSAPRANLDLILRLTQTERFFDALVSMEDTQRGKPDPQVFLTAAAKVSIPPGRCLVVEDAVAGVQAARAGGMYCIAVAFAGHHPIARLQEAGADLVVKTLREVSADTVRQILVGKSDH